LKKSARPLTWTSICQRGTAHMKKVALITMKKTMRNLKLLKQILKFKSLKYRRLDKLSISDVS
jgi:hypothetical protein